MQIEIVLYYTGRTSLNWNSYHNCQFDVTFYNLSEAPIFLISLPIESLSKHVLCLCSFGKKNTAYVLGYVDFEFV